MTISFSSKYPKVPRKKTLQHSRTFSTFANFPTFRVIKKKYACLGLFICPALYLIHPITMQNTESPCKWHPLLPASRLSPSTTLFRRVPLAPPFSGRRRKCTDRVRVLLPFLTNNSSLERLLTQLNNFYLPIECCAKKRINQLGASEGRDTARECAGRRDAETRDPAGPITFINFPTFSHSSSVPTTSCFSLVLFVLSCQMCVWRRCQLAEAAAGGITCWHFVKSLLLSC